MTTAAAPVPDAAGPLQGTRVGVTSTRKVDLLCVLLQRRGAEVQRAPVLREQAVADHEALRSVTEAVVGEGVDLLVATTGTGMEAWLRAAAAWGGTTSLLETLGRAEVLARGPKSVGVLRRHGLRETWQSPTERLEDVLALLRTRDLDGCRLVLQEHGQSLAVEANALRRAGARVTVVSTYRCDAAGDITPVFGLVDLVVARQVDAVTFTSAPAVTTLLQVGAAIGLHDELVEAFRRDVVPMCVGPVTAAAWTAHGVPAPHPPRSRLGAMVTALEQELRAREAGATADVAGRLLTVDGDRIALDGAPVRLSGAPLAVLQALAARPGHVVSRRELMTHLPSGLASTEHAVEVAVARLRAAVGSEMVQTVVKRGYRLACTRAPLSTCEAGLSG